MTKRTKLSKGEQIILATLVNLNVEFRHEHKFDDCRNNKPLPFDFYLPQWNTLIEFDGEHHFRFKSFWNKGRTSLEVTQKNDRLKNRYCKTKGLKLIRIPFKMVDKIETILIREHKKGFTRNLNLSKKLIKRKPKQYNALSENISVSDTTQQ